MKKINILQVPFFALVLLFIINSATIASASSFDYGLTHDFSEDYFSQTIDIPLEPFFPEDNASVSLAYVNASGIEVAYLGLEKVEMDLRLSDIFSDLTMAAIERAGYGDMVITDVNGTTPFQQLLEHWSTIPDPTTGLKVEKFIANNFMALMAYSTTPEDKVLDKNDTVYLGYTMAFTQLTDALNLVLEEHGFGPVPQYDAQPIFEVINDHEIHFGMNYENMMTFWQKVNEEPINPILDNPNLDPLLQESINKLESMVAGFHAATVFDHLTFTYNLTWSEEIIEDNGYNVTVVTANIDTHYDIGEVSWLITDETTIPGTEYTDSFTQGITYEIDLPGSGDIIVTGLGTIPDKITQDLNLAFYPNDDAQRRISDEDGFGFAVMTKTNSVGLTFLDSIWDDPTNPTTISAGNDFVTSFDSKKTYKLLGVDELGFNSTVDRDVVVYADTYSNLDYAVTELAMGYADASFELYSDFTMYLIEQGLGFGGLIYYPVEYSDYLTITQFGDWVGGEIVHDPSYSAVAAVAATGTSGEESTTSNVIPPTGGSEDETSAPAPGFELLSLLLAVPAVYALSKKKK